MYGQTPEEIFGRKVVQDALPLDVQCQVEAGASQEKAANNSQTATSLSSEDAAKNRPSGGLGEQNVEGPVNPLLAMKDSEKLHRSLSYVSNTRSGTSHKTQKAPLWGSVLSRNSITPYRTKSHATNQPTKDEDDLDEMSTRSSADDEFQLEHFLKEGRFEKRNEEGRSGKKVGVVFKHLTVKGFGHKSRFVRTFPEAVLGSFGVDLYNAICGLFPSLRFGRHENPRDLIRDFSGVVRHGEMMLVLGRPGSGCSTLLKAIANKRELFAGVEGDVRYGGISAKEQSEHYRGEVIYNPEEDSHLPSLNVEQTLNFALWNKTRKQHSGDVTTIVDALLRMFAITHTRKTLVGNEYVHGISGGERKRVSIAETLATKGTITCWDNTTRGLDASSALDYARFLRIMTDVSDRTTITTLYQAGEEIYELMDKVLVIEDGRMIFQGPSGEAREYFTNLGFSAYEQQTTADFLTSVGDANERQFREGFDAQCPKTAEDLETAFRESDNFKKLRAEISDYENYLNTTDYQDAASLRQTVKGQKSKTVSKNSNYTVSFWRQVLACTKRESWLTLGDRASLYTKFFIIISIGLIFGSLFYNQPQTTQGAFSRGGTALFSVLFLGWLQLSELMKAVSGRVVIARHKEYAFYRPSAVSIARIIVDFPMLLVQVITFTTILYFITNLDRGAGKFFVYVLFVYTTTFCITALYRMMASLSPTINDAVRFSGSMFNLLVIYTGYVIPKPQLLSQKIWFGWIYYVNPISYAFEGVLANEFSGREMECADSMLIPQGPGVQSKYQGCAGISGADLGSTVVLGDQYLAVTYEYSRANLWRNFGVVIAFSVLYILVTLIATEALTFVGGGSDYLLFKKSSAAKKQIATESAPIDEEQGHTNGNLSSNDNMQRTRTQEAALEQLSRSNRVFTWSKVTLDIPTPRGDKKLLNEVSGYVKPGVMVALMGASGAGKTTLLNTLSRRQNIGVVTGEIFVDGRPLGIEFQRGTGFVEQMDLHDATATVREALEFSAILRQERHISRKEKVEYVDKVIDLLELQDIQDTIIISLGVEQKKRLTIGIELAAKPALLLFLDEPTSGLDSQSAFSIVRFLKKLSRAGQAIICTIHQPSSMLIQQFDMILALNPGGNTFYFGPVGPDGSAVIKYFGDRGVHCPPHKNVAEFVIETAAKRGKRQDGTRMNWNNEWRESKENQELLEEIKRIHAERGQILEQGFSSQHAFAVPVWEQSVVLTRRMFIQQWRDPSYLYGKLFTSVVIGIFNGFTFWNLGNTMQEMQNRMFTVFLIILIPPTIVNAVVPKFYQNRALWEARELPSRTYGWFAFCTASVVTEIPAAIAGAVVYFILWYFATGLPTDAATAGYVFLMTVLFFLFQASWGQWICAFAPSFMVISNVLPFFFVIFSLFNGVVVPYAEFNVFWKYWIYWLNPSTWWIGGIMAATLRDVAVRCAENEITLFNPPPGQTCQRYAGAFVEMAGRGYLTNPQANATCGYCPYGSGVEYLATLNITPGDKWRDFGVFLVFCVSNWALVYFFIYTVRVKGWSFGLATLFAGLDKCFGAFKGLFRRGGGKGIIIEPGTFGQ